MALTLGEDTHGAYAVLECDAPGCPSHVSIRPAGPGWSPEDLCAEAVDCGLADGWVMAGPSYCPGHREWLLRPPLSPGDWGSWADLYRRAPRPS